MQTILSALLWFVKTIKDGKTGREKYHDFLLPNNRSIQVGALHSTCVKQRGQEVKITGRPGNKHDIQTEKWKVGEKLSMYENLRRTYF